ncbi:CoA-binding protein [Salipiger sp.]|uniref:CoA-binding protein n=1 Tax=Salipiger sp. TaxID=2078585 RepID=UPI003A987038
MARDLSRLLGPRSVAIFGSGAWCRSVIANLRAMGFVWDIWPVSETQRTVEGMRCYPSVTALPAAPDAAMIGPDVPGTETILIQLRARNAGGAILAGGPGSEARGAAGDMPVLGPDSLGLLNALDRTALWPDAHGLAPVKRGVAIVAQGPGLARVFSRQRRGLPLACLLSPGSAADWHKWAEALLADDRVSALGLQIEAAGSARALLALGEVAQRLGKPVVVLRPGRDAGAVAQIERAGFACVTTPESFVETLKILHMAGPLPANALAVASVCEGATTTVAGSAAARGLTFAPVGETQAARLSKVLGTRAAASNPLDCRFLSDLPVEESARVLSELMTGGAVCTLVVADARGKSDRAPDVVVEAAVAARERVGMPIALVAPLSDSLSGEDCAALMARGVIPLMGLGPALDAVQAAITIGVSSCRTGPVMMPVPEAAQGGVRLSTSEARLALGLPVHRRDGAVHGAVALDVRVLADPEYGYVLSLRERRQDPRGTAGPEVCALLPLADREIETLLARLGLPSGGNAVVQAVRAVQDYLEAQLGRVAELEISPLFLTAERAAAGEVRIHVAPAVSGG